MAVKSFPVEASHILMFARSVGDDNPVYADADYAAIINDARAAIADGREPDPQELEARVRALLRRPSTGGH